MYGRVGEVLVQVQQWRTDAGAGGALEIAGDLHLQPLTEEVLATARKLQDAVLDV